MEQPKGLQAVEGAPITLGAMNLVEEAIHIQITTEDDVPAAKGFLECSDCVLQRGRGVAVWNELDVHVDQGDGPPGALVRRPDYPTRTQ